MNADSIILITGMSGSGKSSAARALEDAGFFVVDNLPIGLLPQCVETMQSDGAPQTPVAVVVDVRNRDFLADADRILQQVRAAGIDLKIFFFTASDETLARRYSETRRRHPLASGGTVANGIRLERELMRPLRAQAHTIFDSTGLSLKRLRLRVLEKVANQAQDWPLSIQIQSFGFRYGAPRDSDLVFDVRFMPNPYYIDHLRDLTGLDTEVQQYVLSQQACKTFLDHLHRMLDFLLPEYRNEGKNYLTIAFGCTGGQHRSVTLAETLYKEMSREGIEVNINHRDVDRRSS